MLCRRHLLSSISGSPFLRLVCTSFPAFCNMEISPRAQNYQRRVYRPVCRLLTKVIVCWSFLSQNISVCSIIGVIANNRGPTYRFPLCTWVIPKAFRAAHTDLSIYHLVHRKQISDFLSFDGRGPFSSHALVSQGRCSCEVLNHPCLMHLSCIGYRSSPHRYDLRQLNPNSRFLLELSHFRDSAKRRTGGQNTKLQIWLGSTSFGCPPCRLSVSSV
mmetsp:Transcript_25409/g.55684  ORF Transcript_25409/g.55684 Transcript_25409/m.55684 type:complete len:216 (+) Transcript_25409:493-1140(+)